MWAVFQFLIVAAVALSNAIRRWTPNPLVASMFGIGAAFVLTYGLVRSLDLLRRLKA